MSSAVQRRWRTFWLMLAGAFVAVGMTHAALVTLNARVTYALIGANGQPLADGSIVYIIGSGDHEIGDSGLYSAGVAASNQMQSYGDDHTNFLADTTLGDDVIIGFVTIGTGSDSNGTFQTAQFEFNDDEITYFYIRFFDQALNPPEGYTNWNNSQMYAASNHPFGVENIDFAPNNNLYASQTNNFVVIPEPGTGSLVLLLAGLAWGMRASMMRRRDT